jgi:leucyl aminopeptidase
MPDAFKLGFAAFALPSRGVLVVFCDDGLLLGPTTRRLLRSTADMVRKAAAAERFKGKLGTTLGGGRRGHHPGRAPERADEA